MRRPDTPEAWHEWRERLRLLGLAMEERLQAAEHEEIHTIEQRDGRGELVSKEETHDRVWFENAKEMRQTISRRDLRTGKSIGSAPARDLPLGVVAFPLTKAAGADGYAFFLDGEEAAEGGALYRVRFEPRPPLKGKLKGTIWTDPAPSRILKLVGTAAVLPPMIDAVSITLEFGPVETGAVQVRRSVLAGSGGLGPFRRAIVVETHCLNYRDRPGGEKSS